VVAFRVGDLKYLPCGKMRRDDLPAHPYCMRRLAQIAIGREKAIASLGIKNMVLGAPLYQANGETPRWNEKRKYHVGLRQTHY